MIHRTMNPAIVHDLAYLFVSCPQRFMDEMPSCRAHTPGQRSGSWCESWKKGVSNSQRVWRKQFHFRAPWLDIWVSLQNGNFHGACGDWKGRGSYICLGPVGLFLLTAEKFTSCSGTKSLLVHIMQKAEHHQTLPGSRANFPICLLHVFLHAERI